MRIFNLASVFIALLATVSDNDPWGNAVATATTTTSTSNRTTVDRLPERAKQFHTIKLARHNVGGASSFHARLTENAWNRVAGKMNNTGEEADATAEAKRHLKKGDDEQQAIGFGQICQAFISEFLAMAVDGTKCQCRNQSESVVCQIPPQCVQPTTTNDLTSSLTSSAFASSCQKPVCTSHLVQLFVTLPSSTSGASGVPFLASSSSSTTSGYANADWMIQSMNILAQYQGADYDGERMISTSDACVQSFILDDTEYPCNACKLCPGGGGIFLDCTNIQPQALLVEDPTCLALFTADIGGSNSNSNASSFDYCPRGGVTEPTTTGMPFTETMTDFEDGLGNVVIDDVTSGDVFAGTTFLFWSSLVGVLVALLV